MNHIFIGAAIPFSFFLIAYLMNGLKASIRMLIAAPSLMLAGATWAVLPDLPRAFGFCGYDPSISMNPKIDVFFWHYSLNLVESTSPLFTLGVMLMALTVFAAAWKELYESEKLL